MAVKIFGAYIAYASSTSKKVGKLSIFPAREQKAKHSKRFDTKLLTGIIKYRNDLVTELRCGKYQFRVLSCKIQIPGEEL